MRPTPVKNIVSEITLSKSDVFLPVFEIIVNAIISVNLKSNEIAVKKGEITVELHREEENPNLLPPAPLKKVVVTDNGQGFTKKNFQSFETPHSHIYKDLGCKGMGRFTCLAYFQVMKVESYFLNNENQWESKAFSFDEFNEIQLKEATANVHEFRTIVSLTNYRTQALKEASAKTLLEFAEQLINHTLVFYLDGKLPKIILIDKHNDDSIMLNDLYAAVSKEHERSFLVKEREFRAYVLKTKKTGNRKNHYIHYCANSRQVGAGRDLSQINSLFRYPIHEGGEHYLLDVYVVSDYLNERVHPARNGFNIPTGMFENDDTISLLDIESKLTQILKEEFEDFYKESQERSIEKTKEYIRKNGVEYRRFLERDDVLQAIPPFSDEKTIDEYLHRISYLEKKKIDKKMDQYIKAEVIDETTIAHLTDDLKEKTAYDADNLADYMCRRKAILQLFKRLLEADNAGKYKLEKDVHKIVMPLGLSGDPVEEAHNLWMLDERFVTYSFVASDIPISKNTQKKSRAEPDVLLWKEGANILDKPTAYGSTSSGEIDSLVIFEFKRPGETAWQKSMADHTWEFSHLIEKYFNAFLYGSSKKNYRGRPVKITKNTPKFGFIILDIIPGELEEYNINKGYNKTPYGTYYKIEPAINLHIEVITFEQLLENANKRHKPFFDKLFANMN